MFLRNLGAVARAGNGAHLVGVDAPDIFDERQLRRAQGRAGALRGALVGQATAWLLERLALTTRRFRHALLLGAGRDAGQALRAAGVAQVTTADRTALLAPDAIAEPALLPFGTAAFDLVLAPWSLHTVNDLPGALLQVRRALIPDGLFLANLPGLGTLDTLRAALIAAEMEIAGRAAPRVAPFATLRDAAGLLQRAGFALPVADADAITLAYAEPLRLLAELRDAGETNALHERSRSMLAPAVLRRALDRLPRNADGRTEARIEVLSLSGWAPAATQQQPLRPGSAAARLADALGSAELPAGESPRG
jgi:SAM-dependent methyltransferase